MFVSNKDNTFHFNFDNIVSWRIRREPNRQGSAYYRPVGENAEYVVNGVSLEEFTEMFEEHKRLTVPPSPSTVTTIWIATAHSESGDDYGPFVFATKPTDDALQAFFRECVPGEFESADEEDESARGSGDWGSYLFVKLSEVAVG